jgi:hypothetical protein
MGENAEGRVRNTKVPFPLSSPPRMCPAVIGFGQILDSSPFFRLLMQRKLLTNDTSANWWEYGVHQGKRLYALLIELDIQE